ncbi:2Fe-2S iron-sulfur cluster-binding protein [Paenibacillus arenilitoris]|uniref:2Fe-2S iron-sulfur cluster binding domain-containing protein n=1 Tax=Paenibacillus arenilitoris TaxID=2772299 RepID=A0A927CP18_9BACL|nr:2Fe-2S iron-sulfur cluster-binding protein [Paenibacillus arenilitoris]MBD2869646.1 2Fe-2S iron-sulfur cluster binding domain-containing protein [Paenibacillus arenilitoris]
MRCKVTFWPSGKTVDVKPGTTLLDAARRAGVPVSTRCGGKAACFMCKVAVRPGSELQPMKDIERRKLCGLESEGIRLACQARAAGKVAVDVPKDPLRAAIERQLARQAEDDSLW